MSSSKYAGRGTRAATPRPTAGRRAATPQLTLSELCDALRAALDRPRPYVAPPLARRALDILAELASAEAPAAEWDSYQQAARNNL